MTKFEKKKKYGELKIAFVATNIWTIQYPIQVTGTFCVFAKDGHVDGDPGRNFEGSR